MKTNIALIGFMGAGKTAVAIILAKKLGKELVEVDRLIEFKAGKAIPNIFRQHGEIVFRELEIEIIREVARGNNQVIACGGGIVLNKINIDRLKERAVVVYLMASPEVIQQRVDSDNTTRPLLAKGDKSVTISDMFQFRQPLYESAADIKIDTSNLDIATTTESIITRLEEYEGSN
jgi:shikimate kinase